MMYRLSSICVRTCRFTRDLNPSLICTAYRVNNATLLHTSLRFYSSQVTDQQTSGAKNLDPLKCMSTPSLNNSINVEFLNGIISETAKNGRRFLLPVSDPIAMEQIIQSFSDIANEGISTTTIQEVILSNPDLFVCLSKNGAECLSVLHTLVDFCNFSYDDALRFLAVNVPDIDVKDHKDIRKRLNELAGHGFIPGKQIGRLVIQCPELVYAFNSHQLAIAFENLGMFFSVKSLKTFLLGAPQALLKPIDETKLKYEYIYFHMAIEPEKLASSYRWIDLSLDEIMMRHEFLKKTGKYKMPDPKKPQYELENPPVHRIFDSTDSAFSREIACASEEEWNVYRAVYEKLKLLEDKDEPYERIKPSMRKTYERRIKEATESQSENCYVDYA